MAMDDDFDVQLRAIANPHRMAILGWLKSPRAHFPPQVAGDLVEDGVCALFIGDKLGLAQPTAAQHLKLLVDAHLLIPKRIKKWTFYRRNEMQLDQLKQLISHRV
jgi:DNA-binding transcriptional ArsR family regulator